MKKALISLVGRPNVGKSSIFNRLMKRGDSAIAFNQSGVTRDRNYGLATLNDIEIIVVDTGGFFPENQQEAIFPDNPHHKDFLRLQHRVPQHEDFLGLMTEQALQAIDESDLVCLVVDVREGLSPFDRQLAQKIREKGKDFWVLANKWDTPKQQGQELPFFALGVKEEKLFTLSAAHGEGFMDLENALYSFLKEKSSQNQEQNDHLWKERGLIPSSRKVWSKLAIIGAPNSGKSTLLNNLLKKDRALVSSLPGTTMDPVVGYFDLYLGSEGEDLKGRVKDVPEDKTDRWVTLEIVDTAGIRRKSMIKEELESQSVFRSLQALTEADIVLMVVDALKGISHHDKRLCEIALEKGKSLLILLNKVDLLKDLQRQSDQWKLWLKAVEERFPFSFCRCIPLSAKTGQFTNRLKLALKETLMARHQKINTGKLNSKLEQLITKRPLCLRTQYGPKVLKIRYATVVKMDPPTVLIFSNLTREIPQPYRRYLTNGLREVFKLRNTPVHLVFRHGNEKD